ncbi:MAG: PAS domain S-box protein, partial [Acetobacteraceae bacterium]|nr:PAS domain S-box protein [Acetobacteraceae bacterium]
MYQQPVAIPPDDPAAPRAAERGGTSDLETLRARVAALEAENAALRRRAEAEPATGDSARRDGEERFRRLVEGARDTAIIAADSEGRITGWSPGAANVFGWPESEALGQDIGLIFTPEDRAAGVPAEEMRAARQDGRAAAARWRPRKDGSRFWASGSLVPLRGAAGKAAGYLEVAHDASEQKRAEEALRAAVEGSPFPTMLHADDGEVLALSRSWTELTGYGPERLRTHHEWLRLAYPGRHEEVGAALEAEFAAGRVVRTGDVAVRTASGEERVWDLQAVPLGRLPDGRRLQMSAAVDVTERRRAEMALRDSERRYRSFVEASAQVFWRVDTEGKAHHPTPAWESFTGQPFEESRGHGWMDAIRPEDRPGVVEAWRRAIAEEKTYEVEYALRRRDGEWRAVLARAVPVRDEAGRVVEWTGTCTDIHERRAAEAALRESEATLSAVLDALPVGVIIADARGRIVRDNAANRELWGVPPETANWEQYGEWAGYWPRTGERIKAHEWAMARALLKGELVKGELVECERFGTKERRFFLNNAAPVRDAAGGIVAGVVAEMDVTELRRAEEALACHRDGLERLVEERTAALMRSVEE